MDAFFRIFPSIALPIFLGALDQTIIATALPAIAASFGTVEYMSWVVVAYLVAYTAAAPLYGRLGDRYGRRPVIIAALAILIVSSVSCALSTRFDMLVASRVVQGLGGGGLITLSQAVLGETLAPRERARLQGYIATLTVSSNAFGPVAGAFLTHHFGWRAVFLINLPLALLAIALACRLQVAPGTGTKRSLDFLGLVLLTVFVAGVLIGFSCVQRLTWEALTNAAISFGIAGAVLLLLIRRERRLSYPLLPIKLLSRPTIWRSDALAACHGATLVSLVTFTPVYLRVIREVSPTAIGPLLLPLSVGVGLGSLITGHYVARTGRTAIFPSVGLAIATIIILILSLAGGGLPNIYFALCLGLVAICMGTVMGVVQVTVQANAPPTALGAASGTVQLSRSLGATLGAGLVNLVLFGTLAAVDPDATRLFAEVVQHGWSAAPDIGGRAFAAIETAFGMAFLTIATFAAGGCLLAWTIPERRLL